MEEKEAKEQLLGLEVEEAESKSNHLDVDEESLEERNFLDLVVELDNKSEMNQLEVL